MSSADWLEIARLRRTRGLKGEIFAESDQAPEWFTTLPKVRVRLQSGAWLGGEEPTELSIAEAKRQAELLVLRFEGIDTPEKAQTLVNGTLCLARELRPAPPSGEVWMNDLVGCAVYDRKSQQVVGQVTGWEDYGAQMALEVKPAHGGEPVLVPFVRTICVELRPEERRIEVEAPDGLFEG